jgi:hypothetical protein
MFHPTTKKTYDITMDMTNNVNNKVKKTNKKRLQHSKGFTTTMLDKT